ncbi:biotin-dependent carboxyltransferase family protein [Agarivorans aestuarii]|uniref:Biotin-dependent carboxyltransferase family protein n=1 Tax=Agarivorans aestuarii TaxID=1563703 RepID=A0ABU7FZ17_9ALTE|nr:biotin-dependent carboxyltransferase family protein [Agarivorans aestuarii]MEE1672412.1 biotin-dependent carboxyltransferase family protein [Agarivorans aestuarii]
MSKAASLTVLRSAPQMLIVDHGRIGFQHIGVSPGGPADKHAFNWANRLLGNPVNSPALEITFGGAKLHFEQACQVAICGATMPLSLEPTQANNNQIANWHSIRIEAGQTLHLGPSGSGLRAYLAIQGGFILNNELNSVSSSPKQALGPFNGRALKPNDKLFYPLKSANQLGSTPVQQTPNRYIPNYKDHLKLALIPGYQFHAFSQQQRQQILQQDYQLSDLSDRMGLRLNGTAIKDVPLTKESEAIALGAVQIPPNGLPIILSVDRQTIGGYPKLGCISRLDLFTLNQRHPKQSLSFYLSTVEEQRQRWLAFENFFKLSLKSQNQHD